MPFDTSLATVRCPTPHARLFAILDSCGLRGEVRDASDCVHIFSGGRSEAIDVDQDLLQMALQKMTVERQEGTLPTWTIV